MAAPNIVNVTNITGKTASLAVTTSPTALVTNTQASSQIYKINYIIATNITITPADITVDLYRLGTTVYPLAYTITVPEKSTLVIIGKDTAVYLEEYDTIRVSASVASALVATTSYEIIS